MDGIVFEGVGKRFGSTVALAGVSLAVSPGEILGLCGRNGAGKTTLLRIAATLLTPDEGTGSVAGADLRREADVIRGRIGVALVNERAFYWRLDGPANLVFFARMGGMSGRTARKEAEALCDAVGLGSVARRPVRTWSAGQRQRLVIARALLGSPPVLLLDEPLRGLDDDGISRVSRLLREYRDAGACVLMAAPTEADLRQIHDRTVWLRGAAVEPMRSTLVST